MDLINKPQTTVKQLKGITFLPLMAMLLIVIYSGTSLLGKILLTTFIPNKDKEYGIMRIELPPVASEEKTCNVIDKIDRILSKNP